MECRYWRRRTGEILRQATVMSCKMHPQIAMMLATQFVAVVVTRSHEKLSRCVRSKPRMAAGEHNNIKKALMNL
jgi:hypothetical protein